VRTHPAPGDSDDPIESVEPVEPSPIAHPIAHAIAEEVKPHLRGWLHAVALPLAIAGGLALVTSAQTVRERVGLAVFTVTAAQLLGTSAVFHRGRWSPRTARLLNRLDHVGIFFIIAGSSTAFALTVLPDPAPMLLIVWSGAVVGAIAKVFWMGAPRWATTGAYLALGWVMVLYLKPLHEYGGPVILALIVLGGLLYTVGAIVYGTRRPNPGPRWFGFHEVFHAFTLLALAAHGAAAYLAIG
jgi:hemolysin III